MLLLVESSEFRNFDRPLINNDILSVLLTLDRSHNLPRVLTRPELTVINSLPSTRVQLSIRNRHAHTSPHQRTLDVRRHIVQSLGVMSVHVSLLVFRRDAVQGI